MSCGASCELRCSVGTGRARPGPAPRRAARRPAGAPRARRGSRPSPAAGRPGRRVPRFPGLDGALPLVGEARQDPGGLLEGAQARPAGRRDRPAGPEVVDQAPGARRGLVVEELPVDHHDRGVVAGRVALDVLQGDLAVVGGLAVADAQMLLELFEDGVAAHHRAQRVGAHPDLVVAGGPAPVHGVEGGDGGHLGRGQAEHVRAEPHPGARDVALLRLHQVQQRQQGGPGVRVAGDDLARVGLQSRSDVVRVVGRGQLGHAEADALLRGTGGHRSTPPITGSMDATATMTSATWPPSHIAAIACRLVKDGSRKWTR